MEYTIQIYEKKDKKIPFHDWLWDQDQTVRNIIRRRIDRLSLGNFSNSKPIGGGVYEIVIDQGPGYRIYYAMIGVKIVLVMCVGDKRTQQKDIEKAKDYFKDYKVRGKDHGKKQKLS